MLVQSRRSDAALKMVDGKVKSSARFSAFPVASIINVPIVVMSVSDRLTEHGRRLRIWAAEISPRGADDVIEMTLRQVLRVARVVELEP